MFCYCGIGGLPRVVPLRAVLCSGWRWDSPKAVSGMGLARWWFLPMPAACRFSILMSENVSVSRVVSLCIASLPLVSGPRVVGGVRVVLVVVPVAAAGLTIAGAGAVAVGAFAVPVCGAAVACCLVHSSYCTFCARAFLRVWARGWLVGWLSRAARCLSVSAARRLFCL